MVDYKLSLLYDNVIVLSPFPFPFFFLARKRIRKGQNTVVQKVMVSIPTFILPNLCNVSNCFLSLSLSLFLNCAPPSPPLVEYFMLSAITLKWSEVEAALEWCRGEAQLEWS